MSRALLLSPRAEAFLSALPPKQYKQVAAAVFALAGDPRPHDSRKLVGYDDFYRKTCGEYRIVYSFNETVVNIDVIANRNDDDAYRILSRIH